MESSISGSSEFMRGLSGSLTTHPHHLVAVILMVLIVLTYSTSPPLRASAILTGKPFHHEQPPPLSTFPRALSSCAHKHARIGDPSRYHGLEITLAFLPPTYLAFLPSFLSFISAFRLARSSVGQGRPAPSPYILLLLPSTCPNNVYARSISPC